MCQLPMEVNDNLLKSIVLYANALELELNKNPDKGIYLNSLPGYLMSYVLEAANIDSEDKAKALGIATYIKNGSRYIVGELPLPKDVMSRSPIQLFEFGSDEPHCVNSFIEAIKFMDNKENHTIFTIKFHSITGELVTLYKLAGTFRLDTGTIIDNKENLKDGTD